MADELPLSGSEGALMKLDQHFFRVLAIAGLSVSIAAAQTTGTTGAAANPQTGTVTDTEGNRTGKQGTTAGTPASQSGTANEHTGHVAGAAGNTRADSGDMVGKTDRQFMMKAAQGGMMEVQLAQMAQQKAASDDVKQFARQLEQDHSKANDQLKKIATERGVDLPSDIGQHQQQVAKLQNLSGEEFDRAFMKMQVQHHKKDINDFKKHANRSMDTNVKEFANAQLPVLQQHYERAQQIAANTGTRSRKADKMDPGKNESGSSTGNQEQGSRNQ